MRAIDRLLHRVTDALPCRIIAEDERPYLERYFVFQALGISCYLHRFVGSDPDRGVHDHPWRWALSLLLSGSYVEERRYGSRPIRWVNFLTGDSFHRVVLAEPMKPVWTLFIHSTPKVKPWGFLRRAIGAGGQGVEVFEPHQSQPSEHWWKTALKGRETLRRQPQ